MTRVLVFLPGYNMKQQTVLRAFAQGINHCGGGAQLRWLEDPYPRGEEDARLLPETVAVIFGLVKKAYAPTHAKQKVLDRHRGFRLVVAESAFVKRGRYWAVGFGGTAGNADFRADGMPLDRFEALGVPLGPWQIRKDGPLVVCGQLLRDTQVQHLDHARWCRETVAQLQAAGHRVLFRPHPKEDFPTVYGVARSVMDSRPLKEVLAEAKCVVTWNSTTATEAAIAGVPVVACDASSMAWPVAGHGLESIGRPDEIGWLRVPFRDAWLATIGYAQWTLAEMEEGLPWLHLTRP